MNSFGRFAILGSAILAAISMWMGWEVSMFLLFSFEIPLQLQLTIILLMWSYPVLVALFGWQFSNWLCIFLTLVGIVLAVIALATIVTLAVSGQVISEVISLSIFSVDVDIGTWMFLIATLVLVAGIGPYLEGYIKAKRAEGRAMSFSASLPMGRLLNVALWLFGDIQRYLSNGGKGR